MKLSGAVLAFVGCLSAAAMWSRARKEQLKTLDRLAQALTLMEGELTAKAAALPALLAHLAQRTDGAAGRFFAELCASLSSLGSRPFSELWTEAAQRTLPELRNAERAAFADLGEVLGRYPLSMQQGAIARCRAELEGSLASERTKGRDESRLVWGLALSAAAMIWIVLI